jgi:hypothetical protein
MPLPSKACLQEAAQQRSRCHRKLKATNFKASSEERAAAIGWC